MDNKISRRAAIKDMLFAGMGLAVGGSLLQACGTKDAKGAKGATLDRSAGLDKSYAHIPCTACAYCMPCPHHVDIPGNFKMFNAASDQRCIPDPDNKDKDYRKKKKAFLKLYNALPDGSRADACVNCDTCLPKCPQHIRIPSQLEMIRKLAEKL